MSYDDDEIMESNSSKNLVQINQNFGALVMRWLFCIV